MKEKDQIKLNKLQQTTEVKTGVGDFEIIENNMDYQPLEENLQANEASLIKDIQAGEELIQNVQNAPGFVQNVVQPEVDMDEKFKTAHKMAHEKEAHPAKMKKSTLKKRRKEYGRKTQEQNAMLAVKAQINDMKNSALRKGLMAELSDKSEFSELSTDDPQYMDQMMDAVMYFSKNENLSVSEMAIMTRDLSLDLKETNFNRMMSTPKGREAEERFNGKMLIYEKLFREVLSWDPNEFALKDNHVMAKDEKLGAKMEKLNLLPVVKTALDEYYDARFGDKELMKKFRDKKYKDQLFPEPLVNELKCRLKYFEDVKAEYDCRIDLMSNKYYALLGQSDTSKLKLNELDDLSKRMDIDPELKAYYDAIKRHRERKDTGRSLKGKKPAAVMDKLRKQEGIKKKNAEINSIKEEWSTKNLVNYKDANKKRQDKLIENGDISVATRDFSNEAVVDYQIASVYKSLGKELTADNKNDIKSKLKERLKDSRIAKERLDGFDKPFNELKNELEDSYIKVNGGKISGTREERECVVAYLLGQKFESENEYGYNDKQNEAVIKEQNKREKQSRIYGKVISKYHSSFNDLKDDGKENVAKSSAETMYNIFKEAAKEDRQKEILEKYSSPEEFCRKCTQEEYNYLMRLYYIGSAVNNMVFDYPESNKHLMKLINESEFKDFYIKLKTSAYAFGQSVTSYMKMMANVNYAFMDEDTLYEMGNANPITGIKPKTTDRSLEGSHLSFRVQSQSAFGQINKARVGEDFAEKREADEKQYKKEMKKGKWDKALSMTKGYKKPKKLELQHRKRKLGMLTRKMRVRTSARMRQKKGKE